MVIIVICGCNWTSLFQSKCETLIKDRDAVQTILEHKIKVLVQSVAQGANAMVNSTPGGSASGIGQALSKVRLPLIVDSF